jgi:hypothetical protein
MLLNVGFKKEVELEKKVSALGGKYHHIRNIVEETSIAWKDEYLDLFFLRLKSFSGCLLRRLPRRLYPV